MTGDDRRVRDVLWRAEKAEPPRGARWDASLCGGSVKECDLRTDEGVRCGAGLADASKPVASLIFSGPTGVGKTELAKAVSGRELRSDCCVLR